MGLTRQRLKTRNFYVILFVSVCILLSLWSFLLFLNARLPDFRPTGKVNDASVDFEKTEKTGHIQLSKLGEMMISMLPVDLPFTVFIPSERALQRVLQLNSVESLLDQKVNETFAILSRVMGFSTVPWRLTSREMVTWTKEVLLDSVSGFRLHAHGDSDGSLRVNNVSAESLDLTIGEITVHIMNGVLMDAEFEQSFSPDDED